MVKSWRKNKSVKPDFGKKDVQVCPPTWFFDQMAFIGDEIVGCFVIPTEKGIVMLDCLQVEQRCIDMIEDGFKQLGLDIKDLYAVIITHGHGDHYGCVDYFKDKYKAKIYLSEIDYNYAKNMPSNYPWDPVTFEVDHFLQDGEVLDFGDVKIKAVFTPGHTLGCYSFIIPVTDEGRSHKVAMWGGSSILGDSDTEKYYHSLVKFSKICRETDVDGEISAHPSYDMGLILSLIHI